MRNWLRRLAGFSLVPLSLLPLGAIVPFVAPSVAKRIDVLQGVVGTAPADAHGASAQPAADPLALPPLVSPGHDRRHARATTKRTRRAHAPHRRTARRAR